MGAVPVTVTSVAHPTDRVVPGEETIAELSVRAEIRIDEDTSVDHVGRHRRRTRFRGEGKIERRRGLVDAVEPPGFSRRTGERNGHRHVGLDPFDVGFSAERHDGIGRGQHRHHADLVVGLHDPEIEGRCGEAFHRCRIAGDHELLQPVDDSRGCGDGVDHDGCGIDDRAGCRCRCRRRRNRGWRRGGIGRLRSVDPDRHVAAIDRIDHQHADDEHRDGGDRGDEQATTARTGRGRHHGNHPTTSTTTSVHPAKL